MDRGKLLVRTILAVTAATLIVLSGAAAACLGAGTRDTVRIAVPALEQGTLIYIADSQNYFARNGINIEIFSYDTGAATISALQNGDVDLAEAAEYPFVRAVVNKADIKIIACNDKCQNVYVIGRKDRGMANISDLKGKKIGVARQTVAEFYLGRFLDLHGMSLGDVSMIDVPPAGFADALSTGTVDAMIVWQPYAYQMLKAQGDNAVSWPAHSQRSTFSVLSGKTQWIAAHGPALERFMKALAEAESYVSRNPDGAKKVVRERLGYEQAYLDSVWPDHSFMLSLDFSLIAAMSDEMHWMMERGLTTETGALDFESYIYADGLKAVKPGAVNITK